MSNHSSPTELTVSYRPISALRPNLRNPRTHTKDQIAKIAASFDEFGCVVPILLDPEDRIIAGHARMEAAKLLEMQKVPTIRLGHLTKEKLRLFALAENRLAELAGWDNELLALELGELAELDLDFDITITGFEMPEIDLLIQESQESADPADDIPDIESDVPPVTSVGDLWELGPHRILCADATREDSYERLMADKRAETVITDPPYNVPMNGHATGLGRKTHREFPMASGEMTPPQFTGFLMTIFGLLAEWSIPGSIHFICMDWRHQLELLTAARRPYGSPINLAVWVKTNGGMGSLYRSQHELIYVLKNGTEPHINNVELGRHGRNRTNVWIHPGVNTFRAGRDDELAMHPTVKPVEMVADALLDCSNRGGIVLDCFGGSGTTLIAAEKTGRRARLMELDPLYVDVTLRRYKALTGEDAVRVDSGVTFSALDSQRNGADMPSDPAANEEVHDV
jgi:DNA modification methylase